MVAETEKADLEAQLDGLRDAAALLKRGGGVSNIPEDMREVRDGPPTVTNN
jgi:hypothetical protein